MVRLMSELQLYAVHSGDLTKLSIPRSVSDLHEVFDAAEEAQGIYSALRTYHHDKFLDLNAHLDRCRRCVEGAGWTTSFALDSLAQAIGRAVDAWPGSDDLRLRFDLLQRPVKVCGVTTQVLLGISEHQPVSPRVMEEGARLALAPADLKRPKPTIKFTDWVRARRVCHDHDADAFEHLLLDADGRILEGSSSNFWAVRDGAVITAADGVLEGITRRIVLQLCEERGQELRHQRLLPDELRDCQEAFITSSTREIVPVRQVGEYVIGRECPGPVTVALLDAYHDYVARNAKSAPR